MLIYLSGGYLIGMAVWLLAMGGSLMLCLKLRRRWKASPGRTRSINLALSLWMFLAAISALEAGVALFYDQSDSFNMTNVSRRWFTRHVSSNPQGYRDTAPFTPELPAGQKRIVCMGDSFTFGHGVPDVADRFSDRIAADLQRTHPGKFVVANLGIPGLELNHVIRILRDDVLDAGYHVDMVVYTICLNDIEPFHDEQDPARKLHERIAGLEPQFFLLRDTYFLNLLYFRLLQFRLPEVRGYYSHLQDSYRGEPWTRMRQALDELRRICISHQVDLRIVVFPFLHNLGPDYPFHQAHRVLLEWCRENKVPALDLEPVLAPHVKEGLTVNRFDAHPNARAHQLAADAILHDLLGESP